MAGCDLSECGFHKAEQLAFSVVEANPGNMLDTEVKAQKLAELGAIEFLFEKCASECTGMDKDGKCGSAPMINDARSFIFGSPGIAVTAKATDVQIGFTGRR